MSDNSRRFSDFDSLRALSGQGGRAQNSDDPLAELARLVSRNEPQAYDSYQDPRYDHRAYGAPTEPEYQPDSSDDFFEDASSRSGEEDDFSAHGDTYGAYHPGYRSARFDDDFETQSGGFAEEDDRDLPVRRRGGLVTVAAVVAVALLGGVGAWAYGSFGGDESVADAALPVIKPAPEPHKTAPPVAAQVQEPPRKLFYDPLPKGDANDNNVVPSAEEPAARPPAIEAIDSGYAPAPAEAAPAAPEAPTTTAQAAPTGPRVVRTMTFRPDGSPVVQPSPAQALAPEPPPATGPIVGSGPAAEGISMMPAQDGGILQTEPAPAPPQTGPAEPPAASAAPIVPMPEARPSALAARATRTAAVEPVQPSQLDVPAGPSGPPSSPQPQVKVTNKRALQPQGAPPPPRVAPSARPVPPPIPPAPDAALPPPQRIALANDLPAPLPPPSAPRAPATATASIAPAVAAAPAPGSAFSVQVTSQPSEESARSTFTALQRRYPAILGSHQPNLRQVSLPQGTFYRVQIAMPSQSDAANLCTNLKAAGGDCIVHRN